MSEHSAERRSRYEASGWLHWPDHEVESTQLKRLLADAQEGASCVSECFATAEKIRPGDDESWSFEWRKLADRIAARARLSSATGNFVTARSEWLRALNYYRAATIFFGNDDPRCGELLQIAESCAALFLRLLSPLGEILDIRSSCGMVRGYLVRSPDAPQRSPVIVVCGQRGETKEDLLVRFQAHAIARGLTLLVLDLTSCVSTQQAGRSVYYCEEDALRSCLDYLLTRDDIDGTKIALWGDGLGGILATRVAATDSRLAAVVCDGGFWDDLEERHAMATLNNSVSPYPEISGSRYRLAKKIKCPCLVVIGEHDYPKVADVIALQEHCIAAGVRMELKIFWSDDTGASHRQLDNPTIGRQFIFDWIKIHLRLDEVVQHSASFLGNPHAQPVQTVFAL